MLEYSPNTHYSQMLKIVEGYSVVAWAITCVESEPLLIMAASMPYRFQSQDAEPHPFVVLEDTPAPSKPPSTRASEELAMSQPIHPAGHRSEHSLASLAV